MRAKKHQAGLVLAGEEPRRHGGWRPSNIGLLAVALLLLAPAISVAHPLGMSSVNRYGGVLLLEKEIEVDYLLDFAELPAYAEIESLDSDHDNAVTPKEQDAYLDALIARIAPRMSLTVDGSAVAMHPAFRALTAPPGQNGLSTLRVAIGFRAERPTTGGDLSITFSDPNFSTKQGWRELEARDSAFGTVVETSQQVRTRRAGAQLIYPADALATPPRDDVLRATFRPGAGAAAEAKWSMPSGTGAPGTDGKVLAGLVRSGEWSVSFLILAFATAFALGAGHALTPGHGKTLVAAYLIGERSRVRDALILGATVTATHTASVFALGFLALILEKTLGTESVVRMLGLVSGALVALIAAWQMPGRIRRFLNGRRPDHRPEAGSPRDLPLASLGDRRWQFRAPSGGRAQQSLLAGPGLRPGGTTASNAQPHEHSHGEHGPGAHHHGDGRWHSHGPVRGKSTLASIVLLGVSGGLLPCPGALVVLLTAISLHRIWFGLGLLVAFSLGLATVLSVLATIFVLARRRFDRLQLDRRLGRALPVASSAIVFLLGVAIVARHL